MARRTSWAGGEWAASGVSGDVSRIPRFATLEGITVPTSDVTFDP